MSEKLSLGVLDFCDSITTTIRLAPRIEAFGYSRYWLAEHHGDGLASPELLIPILAGLTKRIRVGMAGVLLSFYSPLKVADNFKLLELLFPQRIDLGIGRGGADQLTTQALLDGRTRELDLDLYKEKIEYLIDYLHGNSQVRTTPAISTYPEVWVLGTGLNSMHVAAHKGLAYSHSLFHRGCLDDPSILKEYRETFQPHGEKVLTPRCNIAVAGICADTEARAYELQQQHANNFVMLNIVGTANQCKEKLLALQERYDVNEIIFFDVCREFNDRLRSYELLAGELRLTSVSAQTKQLAVHASNNSYGHAT
ncbi:MsnO8 family LLM class oxidoreductase [Nostoc sp.]|uniref:MsnO8 family LLM class oxidoreductase n=1 Tax=Nostoc sp. TaxID=1180 RepID=UPI002FF7137A